MQQQLSIIGIPADGSAVGFLRFVRRLRSHAAEPLEQKADAKGEYASVPHVHGREKSDPAIVGSSRSRRCVAECSRRVLGSSTRNIRSQRTKQRHIMRNSSSSPEASAIQEAYAEQIRGLFKVLCTNLSAPRSDRHGAEKFSAGLNLAKRARDLALSAIETPAAKERPSRTPTPSRKKRASL
jgi:hypothetical protein